MADINLKTIKSSEFYIKEYMDEMLGLISKLEKIENSEINIVSKDVDILKKVRNYLTKIAVIAECMEENLSYIIEACEAEIEEFEEKANNSKEELPQ